MWISKKKWEEMEDEIYLFDERLRKVHNRLDLLEFSHGKVNLQSTPFSVHNSEIKIPTTTIPNITLEELARFVIDGEPIKRKQEIDVEYRRGE